MATKIYDMSFPRKLESIKPLWNWIPAFAGMTYKLAIQLVPKHRLGNVKNYNEFY